MSQLDWITNMARLADDFGFSVVSLGGGHVLLEDTVLGVRVLVTSHGRETLDWPVVASVLTRKDPMGLPKREAVA